MILLDNPGIDPEEFSEARHAIYGFNDAAEFQRGSGSDYAFCKRGIIIDTPEVAAVRAIPSKVLRALSALTNLGATEYKPLRPDKLPLFESAAKRTRDYLMGSYMVFLAGYEDDPLIVWTAAEPRRQRSQACP